ncbi:hypothetical protein LIER_26376 [Lithospermum erythrorhizon]|uniref:CCHC-type domain-containing protein n=1 Tax=Lithospermum erythrorhizon TaxID=34254 RepID=A0AAV3RB60_LITER
MVDRPIRRMLQFLVGDVLISGYLAYQRLPNLCFRCGLLGHCVKQCPTLLEGADPRKNLAYDLWIKAPTEKKQGEPSAIDQNVSAQISESSSPNWEDHRNGERQPSLMGEAVSLGYSKGAITLKQKFWDGFNIDGFSRALNETVKHGIDHPPLNEIYSKEFIIRETDENELIQNSMQKEGIHFQSKKTSFTFNKKEEADLNSTLQFFNFQKGGTQPPTERQHKATLKGKMICSEFERQRTPSKKRFHSYVYTNRNGYQSKKTSLSSSGLDGSSSPIDQVGLLCMELSGLGNPGQFDH